MTFWHLFTFKFDSHYGKRYFWPTFCQILVNLAIIRRFPKNSLLNLSNINWSKFDLFRVFQSKWCVSTRLWLSPLWPLLLPLKAVIIRNSKSQNNFKLITKICTLLHCARIDVFLPQGGPISPQKVSHFGSSFASLSLSLKHFPFYSFGRKFRSRFTKVHFLLPGFNFMLSNKLIDGKLFVYDRYIF